MNKITDKELKQIDGGAWKIGLLVGIGAAVTFLIGVVDGIVRPLKCN